MAGPTCPRATASTRPTPSARWRRRMIEAMEQLGHVHFALAGHDRGGRVAYRLALDHPGRLSKLAVLDILPTYDYWERMNRLYALKIYHWTFLAQPLSAAGNADRRQSGFLPASRRWRARPSRKRSTTSIRARWSIIWRRSAIPRGACDVRGLSRRRLCRLRDRQGGSRRGQEDHHPDAGAVGRCRHRQRRGDAAGYLEELGDQCDGRAGR